ncbi:hypothetical protein BRC94_10485 [Halobacteriales archaeon QS_5_70_17]|nr:MAG: hypothetical protein BRC94_10485 [Halobacteriales archaeon QS_5_70_17]
MPAKRQSLRSWAIGRERSVTDRFVGGVAIVYLVVILTMGWLGVGEAWLPFTGLGWALTTVAVVGLSAAYAYLNDGLLVSVGLAYVLLVAVVAAGVVPLTVTRSGWDPIAGTLLVEQLGVAVVLGLGGGLLGATSRRVRERIR